MKFLRDSHIKVSKDTSLIQLVRLGRNVQVRKEMKVELKLKYGRICRKRGVRKSLGDYSKSDDRDCEDLEAYDGFAGDLIVINVEHTASV